MPDTASPISIRRVTPADVSLVLDLIRGLADYEHEPDAVVTTEDQLQQALFGERPAAEAVIAYYKDEPAALALWFQNFSTWTGRPGLWLEDLFVRPAYRRFGIGRALLVYLARLARDREYGRFEWSVLDWNQPSIDFYRSLGAEAMDAWTIYRLTGTSLERLAGEGE